MVVLNNNNEALKRIIHKMNRCIKEYEMKINVMETKLMKISENWGKLITSALGQMKEGKVQT